MGRSSQARYSAAYRLQVIVEWLSATGHKGMLLFIDEVDNVARQIHGKAHPACFRTLAWYCSARQLQALRVIYALTPEMQERLGPGYRAQYRDSLYSQETVHRDECEVYDRWDQEVGRVGAQGWAKCPALQPEQRLDLFHRIATLHSKAWGSSVPLPEHILRTLVRYPGFNTTRRWVRAAVQLLDLHQQHPLSISRKE